MPVAWLSLDKNDNHRERFLTYLIAALHEADVRIGSEVAQLITEAQEIPSEAILTGLINDLDTANEKVTMVLDDYQVIDSQSVHEAVVFLLEHCPPTFHLVIATRSDPPLPLSRLRSRAQTLELRGADLRFTEVEAAGFLNEVMGLQLDDRSVTLLEDRTEGWIAGLQMAALSMRDRENVPGFIDRFSGTNRYILDYLLEEVLANQPPEIQRFLLCTSILERLTAPLCDALLAGIEGIDGDVVDPSIRFDSAAYSQSTSILEYLEKANLFLVALDQERVWYRYHHLFADLLHARLSHSKIYSMKSLHSRAADWFEQHGYPEDAIQHALAGEDHPRAARLIESLAETVWRRSEYSRLMDWISALPMDLVRSHPWLCVWYAWSVNQIGLLDDARTWIEAAERAVQKNISALSATSDNNLAKRKLEYEIATLNAHLACLMQDYDKAVELSASVLDNPPLQDRKASLIARSHVLHALGSMYYAVGELDRAEEVSQATITAAEEIGFDVRHIHALNKLAHTYSTRGQLYSAQRLLLESIAFFERQGLSRYPVLHMLRCRLMDLLYEWNQIEEIEHQVKTYGLSGAMTELPYVSVDLYNLEARQSLVRNDIEGAQQALTKADGLTRRSYIWPALTRQTESLQYRLWLQSGDLQQLISWDKTPLDKDSGRFPFLSEYRLMARAKILVIQEKYGEALSLLDRLIDSAECGGRHGSLVGIRLSQALTLQSAGRNREALDALKLALERAEAEGYVRTFLDEGQPLQTLIDQWLGNTNPGSLRNYALYLLTQFDKEPRAVTAVGEKGAATGGLIDPLSQRELEVLQLMSLGKTNQQIARQLVVAQGTIKAHASNIYRKLDVSNRTEAIAHARELNILP